ncbi:unnamed protein product [Tilletia controversa]|nr:unnamed protein product [Tilletia controversa]
MSQRVDKGPKFKPSVPIRRPGAGAGTASSSSSASTSRPAPTQPSAGHPPPPPANGESGPSGASARQAEGSHSGSQTNQNGSTSIRPGASPAVGTIRAPTQITAAGLRLTARKTAIAPGSQHSTQAEARPPASIPTPPASGQARAVPITVGRPQPTPFTRPSQEGEASDDEGEDPEDALVRDAEAQGGPIEDEDQADENGQSSSAPKRGKKPPRAKRLTVDEEEAAYEEQIALEGASLAESRPEPEELSMSSLARYEVRAGKASKRTFDMMRKHEVHKNNITKERKELVEMLLRKREAGKDWLEKFGSDEEEAAEDEKRRSLRKKSKKDRQRGGRDGAEDEDSQEDEDAELEGEVSPSTAARVLAIEAGDHDSDDGNSMTSEEGSDLDDPPLARQKKGKGKQGAVPPKRGRGKGQDKTAAPAPQDSSSSGSDSEDDIYGESHAAVQIRLGPDGRPVLSESSLTVDPSQMTDVIDAGVEGVTSVIETERFINSSTRGKKSVNSRWNKDDTDKFFKAISQWGTDFEMIARLFPTRSRHQIKLKFSREEKTDPARINLAFKTRIPVDLEAYGLAVGRNLSGPPPKISIKKPDDYLKMEEQERLLREGGGGAESAIGIRADASSSSSTRRTDRASSSTDRRRPSAAAAAASSEGEEDGGAVSASGDEGPSSSSTRRRSVTPGGRRRSGSNAGANPTGSSSGGLSRTTQRRGGYDRDRDRERAKAVAEEQRRERERLHRAGSGRGGGGVAYESQEMVLGDADDP